MNTVLLWYWFVNIPGIGLKTRHHLLDILGHPKIIWDTSIKELKMYLTGKQLDAFIRSRNPEKIVSSYYSLIKQNICFLSVEDEEYPKVLKNISDFPHGLYLRGKLPTPSLPLLSVVGSRTPSAYGKSVTGYFVKELSRAGIGIVSGLASGIDTAAHRSALINHQYTLGVLGGGIDTVYPRENYELYFEMYQRGGVLSEYNVGTANLPGYFPVRNRIISGLSKGVLVVEAGERSGSLITADLALEQGREIYVIPGRINDPLSCGCNALIKQGARLVTTPEEIIEDFSQQYFIQKKYSDQTLKAPVSFDSEEEKEIYSILDLSVPKSPNEIKQSIEIDFSKLLRILLNMELKQLIRREGNQFYVRNL